LRCLEELDDPDQDNISFCVIKVSKPSVETTISSSSDAGLVQMIPSRGTNIATQTELPTNLAMPHTKKEKITIMASKSDSSVSMIYHISSERSA